MSEQLKAVLKYGGILSEDDINVIMPHYDLIQLKPGEEFLSIGQVSNRIGFIDEGILRVFFTSEKGDQVSLQHIASYLQITPQSLRRIRAKKD